MEFVEGAPLSGPMPLARALTYAGQILDALHAAHTQGIVHRDLKPANIIVGKQGIKLLDFGIAKQLSIGGVDAATRSETVRGEIVGTLHYMSPEQLRGEPVDSRTDIFSFGCVLHEMLGGARPFAGTSTASVIGAILER